jgi:hypothetical protein
MEIFCGALPLRLGGIAALARFRPSPGEAVELRLGAGLRFLDVWAEHVLGRNGPSEQPGRLQPLFFLLIIPPQFPNLNIIAKPSQVCAAMSI